MDKISRSEYEVAQHQVEAQQNTQEGISTGGTDAVGDGQSEAALRILENDLSSIGLDEDSSDEKEFELPLFDSRQCLFCNVQSEVFENNLEHMLKKHGLFIPDISHLIVDVEVLIEYLHLIIYGYSECLYCGSKRNTAEAAKQHMVDKGHCKIDISRKGSEYGDFYDLVEDAGSLGGITDAVSHEKRSVGAIGEVDSMIRLPSGKLLSSRSLTERHNRPRAVGTQSGGNFSTVRYPAALEPFGTGSGTPRVSSIEKASSRKVMNREAAWEHQLASLRVEDRRSLMHLPGWKQRAVVMEGKRLVERARRDDDKMRLKIQLKANP